MDFLVFQLQAPMASWGDTAVGEYRGSHEYPSESALLGLLAAALGIRRDDEAALDALRDGYGFAIGVQSAGTLLRDYQTAQVPGRAALKNRPHATRKDELAIPKQDLNTILSTRDYRQNSAYLVAVQSRTAAPHALSALAAALCAPRFVLYVGRKTCPLAAPLFPQVVVADSAAAAFDSYNQQLANVHDAQQAPFAAAKLVRIVWSEDVAAGVAADLSTLRKDRVIRRRAWQFGDRAEHAHLPDGGV